MLRLTTVGTFTDPFAWPLKGNPLDIAIDKETLSVLVAVDSLHVVGPGKEMRPHRTNGAFRGPIADSDLLRASPYMEGFQYKEGRVVPVQEHETNDSTGLSSLLSSANSWPIISSVEIDEEALGELFYSVEHMRKKGPLNAEDDDDE